MDDALLAMFWAGVTTGLVAGVGAAGVSVAIWFFWPHKETEAHDIEPDDELRVVGTWPPAREDD